MTALIICTNFSVISLNKTPSESIGEMSRNIMPSIGKSGIVLIVCFNFAEIFSDMLNAHCRERRGPRTIRPGPFAFSIKLLKPYPNIRSKIQPNVEWLPGPI